MGKDLKGKELGQGLSQRTDKKYLARYTDRQGKRHNFINESLIECKKWLIECEEVKTHPERVKAKDWYEYWIKLKAKKIKESSVNEYKRKWKRFLEPCIGDMYMDEITYRDFERIFMNMEESGYAKTTIKHLKGLFINMFSMAVKKDIILKNPLSLSESDMGVETEAKMAMTVDEQKQFLKGCTNSYELQFRFLLQTGLRISEMIGLKWDDINFQNKSLKVERQLNNIHKEGWKFLPPKSEYAYRTIYLTDEAIRILKAQKSKCESNRIVDIRFQNLIFLSKNGRPIDSSNYDYGIKKICEKVGMRKISCHILRHTFATRCIEAGMQPKTLQMLLGHSDISITMNRYVTTTDDFKKKEIEKIQKTLNVI